MSHFDEVWERYGNGIGHRSFVRVAKATLQGESLAHILRAPVGFSGIVTTRGTRPENGLPVGWVLIESQTETNRNGTPKCGFADARDVVSGSEAAARS